VESASEVCERGGAAGSTFCFPREYGRDSVLLSDAAMQGDVDNIVKPILDALSRHIYVDDGQVERIVVQKFEPGGVFVFRQPTNIFTEALGGQRPILYVRVSNDPFEELS
jgi:crossover junction endodeoxyribonuclease RusA